MSTDSTPWPLALAFGLAVAELGVFLGFAADAGLTVAILPQSVD